MIYYGKKEKRLSLENGVVFDMKKERIKYITIFAITFILEVIIAKYVHDKIIRPYIGDVLVVICLYTLHISRQNKIALTICLNIGSNSRNITIF